MAGLLDKRKTTKKQIWNKKRIIESFKQFYNMVERVPTVTDVGKNNLPSRSTVRNYFGGSFNNALIEAGLWDKREPYKREKLYTNGQLLEYLKRFYRENGSPPTRRDFNNNPNYPCFATYMDRFGSWENALRLIELDVDSMVRKGILFNSFYKARLAEIFVFEHFIGREGVIDISGNDFDSPIDGICPKGQIYDVKSSHLRTDRYWSFPLDKGGGVDFYYLLAFDKGWTQLSHVWRIPWNFIDGPVLYIWIYGYRLYNVKNMKEYEITEKFSDLFNSWIEKIKK